MFVVDLICSDGHLFEGWYDNRDAFDDAAAHHELTCPQCASTSIERRPAFRGLLRSSSPSSSSSEAQTTEPSDPRAPVALDVQRALSQLIKLVKAHTEDAGDHFADRALAMHKGDEPPVPIHGTTTAAQRAQLLDEGVPFAAIPVPDIDQN
jgi:hypothetical protein